MLVRRPVLPTRGGYRAAGDEFERVRFACDRRPVPGRRVEGFALKVGDFERLVVVETDPVRDTGPALDEHVDGFLREQVDAADAHLDVLGASDLEPSAAAFGAVLDLVLHGQLTRPLTDLTVFDDYLAVTRAVSQEILDTLDERRTWVYLRGPSLLAVPAMLRADHPELRITLRLPTPWPAPESFARLPWRRRLLEGAAGADVISLSSERDRKNLTRSFGRYLPGTGVAIRKGRVMLGDGRRVRTLTNPPSFDIDRVVSLATGPAVEEELAAWEQRVGKRQVVLAVERVHASSGLLEQLTALERLLERRDGIADGAAFVIVAAAASEDDPSVSRAIERTVGRINEKFIDAGGEVPVHYLHGGVSVSALGALFRLARVLVATPLAAGASMAVKEYVVVQHAFGGRGRIVLSETSGTAAELPMLATCNPFAADEVAGGIVDALVVDDVEAERTLAAAVTRIRRHGLAAWWRYEIAVAENPKVDLED